MIRQAKTTIRTRYESKTTNTISKDYDKNATRYDKTTRDYDSN